MSYNTETLLEELTDKMDNAIGHYQKNLDGIRTGKADPRLIQDVMISAYGTTMKLRDTANVSTPDSRTINIQPFDRSIIKEIEKAIMMSGIGITPINDGTLLRLPMPELTEERRKDLVKMVKTQSEEYKVEIRNIRRDGNDFAKKASKGGELTEDDLKLYLDDIQKLTDGKIKELVGVAAAKEKELMTV